MFQVWLSVIYRTKIKSLPVMLTFLTQKSKNIFKNPLKFPKETLGSPTNWHHDWATLMCLYQIKVNLFFSLTHFDWTLYLISTVQKLQSKFSRLFFLLLLFFSPLTSSLSVLSLMQNRNSHWQNIHIRCCVKKWFWKLHITFVALILK